MNDLTKLEKQTAKSLARCPACRGSVGSPKLYLVNFKGEYSSHGYRVICDCGHRGATGFTLDHARALWSQASGSR